MAQYTINNIANDIDFECNSNPIRRTLQNCKNLIMLRQGEIPFDRLRGLDAGVFDMTMPEVNSNIAMLTDLALEWEPDADLVSARATMLGNGQLYIECVVEINAYSGGLENVYDGGN